MFIKCQKIKYDLLSYKAYDGVRITRYMYKTLPLSLHYYLDQAGWLLGQVQH